MLGSVRAQLYRLFHGRMFWVFLAVLALPMLLSAVLLAVISGNSVLAALFGTSGDALASAAAPGVSFGVSTSSDFARLVGAVSDESAPFALYGSSFVNGSFVGMLAAAFTGLFAAQELSADKRRGFAKNLLQVRGGRFSYAASHMVAAAVAGALFVLAGIVCTALFFGLAGFSVMPSSFASFALWAVQVWLATFAYQLVTLLAVFATRSEAAGVLVGILLGGFAVEKGLALAVGAAAAAIGPAEPLAEAAHLLRDASPMAWLSTLGHGAVCEPAMFAAAGLVCAVAAALGLAVMRRRSMG